MPIVHDEAFRAWEACVSQSLRDGPVWKFHAYRVSLYLFDVAARDAEELRREKRLSRQTDRLLQAARSVSANLAEGFSLSAPEDRSRFFEVALGSVRECLTRYRALQSELDPDTCELRLNQLSELRQILLGAQKWLSTKPQRSHMV